VGDDTVQMATAPDDPKRLYAAGYHSLSESRDGGQHWTALRIPSESSPIVALAPLPGGVLLAGTASGLFRSAEGATWTMAAGDGVQAIQRSPGDAVAVLTAKGALVSMDAGLTWKACGDAGSQGSWYGLAFDTKEPGKDTPETGNSGKTPAALAATPAGLFRSTDGCRTWTQVHEGLDTETVSLVMFHPTRQGEAFVSQGGRIFVSTDGGQRWLPIDDEAGGNAGPASLVVLSAAPDTLFALFPRRGVYTTGIGFWTAPTGRAEADKTAGKVTGVAARPRYD
jgi:photosystem II stability/assembly factor-like uncharacterized protein